MDKTNLSQKNKSYLRGVNEKLGLNKDHKGFLSKANSEGQLNPKFNKLVRQGQAELNFPSLNRRVK
jgi:hypothetical protein